VVWRINYMRGRMHPGMNKRRLIVVTVTEPVERH
jgi:hypothetical protein